MGADSGWPGTADAPMLHGHMPLPYSSRYYEGLKEDSAGSARATVPIIRELFPARTVVDVGCGSGTWAREYATTGCEILGIDGEFVQSDQLVIPGDRFLRRDLGRTLTLDQRFDLVNCLEVAEHLAESRSAGFVADLCQLGDVVIFSAAVPGQGGTHHVNEQWPSYWWGRFQDQGFTALDCLRPRLWGNTAVAWWYVQNMFAFVRNSRLGDFPAANAAARPWPTDLVHPRAYVRATVPSEMSPRMLREVLRGLPHFPAKILQAFR